MTTNAISANPAAALAAQAESAHAARQREDQRKPAVQGPKETHNASRYAEHQASRREGRGRKLDTEA